MDADHRPLSAQTGPPQPREFCTAIYARRDEGLSLLTERVALVAVGGFCLVYVMALVGDNGFAVTETASITVS